MTDAREMLADKIEYATKTQGEVTLFHTHGRLAVEALRLAARSAPDGVVREALEAAREYIADDNNPRSNRVLHKIKTTLDALSPSEAKK